MGAAQGGALLLAGIRAEGATPATFPETEVSSGVRAGVEDRRERLNFVQRTVAGAAQFERLAALSCFPFNCADKTGGTSTKQRQIVSTRLQSTCDQPSTEYKRAMSKIEELADRVERLLLRHDELQRTTVLLEQQLKTVTLDRDSLKSRLNAARSRINTLLERLPTEVAADLVTPAPSPTTGEPTP